jgi:hypothetical protein
MFNKRIAFVFGIALMIVMGLSIGTAAAKGSEQRHRAPPNTVWLCKPGAPNNPCEGDLTATVVNADGTTNIEQASVAKDPPIDCFYVYPTVSMQTTLNSNLNIDPEEQAIATAQAARFSTVCKVYAPMYRQLTLSAITTGTGEIRTDVDLEAAQKLAYGDVLSAWQDYLAHYNNGRGVVLLGHSQGTGMLTQLLTKEIDPSPSERRLLVSALMIGGGVLVPKGWDVGGSFRNIPACHSDTQTRCVIAYSSFLEQPPADTLFGSTTSGLAAGSGKDLSNEEVLCTNPASLPGGSGPLQFYMPTTPFPGVLGTYLIKPPASTPWVSYPGLYSSECESANGINWLQINVNNIPGDPRPKVVESIGPTWGLHLYDYALTIGNLIEIVQKQTAAYLR